MYALPALVLVALAVAAGTTSPRFAGYSASRHHRRWLFLAGKIVLMLMLPIVLFGTLALQAVVGTEPNAARSRRN
ncbi:MAG: hypothetical protein ABSH49_05880 [Bryobacteraceae bacterium]|jgi:hypothetical protein